MKKTTMILSALLMTLMILISCVDGRYNKTNSSNDTVSTNEVTIGKQIWMTKNLNVDTFSNGDTIPEAKNKEQWEKAGESKQPVWCYYENRAIQDDSKNGKNYGKFYNWYAVNDPRGIAPKGYHIPSKDEWTILANYLGGKEIAGEKMKSKSCWEKDDNGTNESGFSGLPGGEYSPDFGFLNFGYRGYWWSSSEGNANYAWAYYLNSDDGSLTSFVDGKVHGYSVRCLRD